MNNRRSLALPAAFAALLVSLGGCEGQPDNGPPPLVKTQESINAQIEKIKNDPNMSPQAKEAATRGIQSAFDNAQRQAQDSKNRAPKKP